MMRASVVRGVGGAGSDKRNPPPKGDVESENVMRSAPHAKADPTSSIYEEGYRCFRTRNPGLGLLQYVNRPRQVGGDVIPGDHKNIRFQPMTAAGDCGEFLTNDPDEIKRIVNHRWFKDGTIVDAVVAFTEARQDRAKALVTSLRADPLLKADFENLLGSDTVSNFLDVVEPPATPGKKARKAH